MADRGGRGGGRGRGRGGGGGGRPDNYVPRGGGFGNQPRPQNNGGYYNEGGNQSRSQSNGGGGQPRGYHNGGGDRGGGASRYPDQGGVHAVEGQMGRMALSGRGGGRGRGRGARTEMTPEQKRELVRRSYDLVSTRGELQSKKGSKGTPIALISNYFGFKTKPDFMVYKYRVDFNDDELKNETFTKKRLLRQHVEKLPHHVFDGSMIFSTERLFPVTTEVLVLSSENKKRDSDTVTIVEITIKSVGEASSTDHDYIHFFNIVWRSAIEKMNLKMMNRNYFDPMAAIAVPQYNLEIWPGYITTIRQQENELLLCAEVANKILRTDSAYACIQAGLNRNRSAEEIRKQMVGAIVVTKYNNKTYRIDDVNFDMSPLSTFEKRQGDRLVEVSYKDYFEERYKLRIRDVRQPILISMPKDRDRRGGNQEPVSLIPELAMMTGLNDVQRSDFKLMQHIGQWTRMQPPARVKTLLTFAGRVQNTKEVVDELRKFNMAMKSELVTFNGRVLPAEKVTTNKEYMPKDADWTQEIQRGLFTGVHMSRWVVIAPRQYEQQVNGFITDNMMRDAGSMGIKMDAPAFEQLNDQRITSYMNAINIWAQKGALFVFVVTPNDKSDIYAAVKKKLCIENPIPNQVITYSKVLSKPPQKYRSLATKVLIQMATKLKAIPWIVNIPLKNAMIVGFDTYHEKEGDMRSASVGALVATYDQHYSQYYSKVTMKPDGTELCTELEGMMTECLRHYLKANGTLPTRVFFYRDGVGEGQVQEVRDKEVAAIDRVLKSEFIKEKMPGGIKLTFIIVSKRINTRLITQTPNGQYINPPSGTVADDVVTCPERYDFFLTSQNVRQGTVNPTSYNVINDESGFTPDIIQALTFKLTHLYFNMSSTVRVPAPCLYAHKLADLVGRNLKAPAHPILNEYLYYL